MTNCFAMKGDLPIEFSWTLNGKSVANIHGVIVTNLKRSSQINIESVDFKHSGEYICYAKNSAGTSSHISFFNVNGILILQRVKFFMYNLAYVSISKSFFLPQYHLKYLLLILVKKA